MCETIKNHSKFQPNVFVNVSLKGKYVSLLRNENCQAEISNMFLREASQQSEIKSALCCAQTEMSLILF